MVHALRHALDWGRTMVCGEHNQLVKDVEAFHSKELN